MFNASGKRVFFISILVHFLSVSINNNKFQLTFIRAARALLDEKDLLFTSLSSTLIFQRRAAHAHTFFQHQKGRHAQNNDNTAVTDECYYKRIESARYLFSPFIHVCAHARNPSSCACVCRTHCEHGFGVFVSFRCDFMLL